jgi:hypothetical protein
MKIDRRRQIRRVVDKFAFIQLERDDGGAVLDISEAGLCFQTFTPILKNGPMHFWFSLDLRERMEAWGEVAWVDETKKTGGLRFIHLPGEARREIRKFASRPSVQKVPGEEFLRPAVTTNAPGGNGTNEPDAVAKFVAKARPRLATLFSGTEGAIDSSTLFPVSLQMEASGELVPMQRYLSVKRQQFILGLLLGVGISAAVAGSLTVYSSYRHKNRAAEEAATENVAQKRAEEASAAIPTGPSDASGSSPDVFSTGKLKKTVARDSDPNNLVAATAEHRGSGPSDSIESNPSTRTHYESLGDRSAALKKTSRTPQQLWASVQTGNSNAALALADLYIKGEGVPQNCTQARMLLLAASEKRNAGAIKRLQELDKTGCPTD